MKTKRKYKDTRVRNLYIVNVVVILSVIVFNIFIKSITVIEIENNEGIKHITKVRKYSDYLPEINMVSVVIIGLIIIFSSIYIYKLNSKNTKRLIELSALFDNVGFEEINEPSSIFEESDLIVIDSWNNSVQEILKQTKNRENYFARMIHDLNTPIQILKLNAQLNTLGFDEETSQIIEDEIKLLEYRIKNYLLIEKISYFETPKIESININQLFKNIEKRYKVLAEELLINLSGDDIYYQTDATMLNHIVQNILENAIKYGKDDEIVIDVNEQGIKISNKTTSSAPSENIFESEGRNFSETGNGLGTEIINAYASLLGYKVKSQIENDSFVVTIEIN